MLYLRRYNVTLASGTAGSDLIRLSIRKTGSDTFATGSDWSPSAGDVKVSKDGGAQANIGTLPSYSNGSWEFTLTGTELSAKTIRVVISAAAIVPADFTVETFGNASAMYPTDYGDGVRLGMTALPNAAANATGGVYVIGGTGTTLAGTQTFNNTGTWTGNLTGSVGSVTGNVGGSVASVTGAISSVTGSVGSVAGNVGGNVVGSVGSIAAGGIATSSFATGATIPRVTLADTLTTYTGNTPQTGDAYARVAAVLPPGTIYVETTGNDSNAGTSPDKPVLTIAQAMTLVANGGTIKLGNGVWTENVLVAKAITIAGSPTPGGTVLKSPNVAGTHAIISSNSGEASCTFRDLTLDNNGFNNKTGINWVPSLTTYGNLLVVERVNIRCSGLADNSLNNQPFYFSPTATLGRIRIRDVYIKSNAGTMFFEDTFEVDVENLVCEGTFGLLINGDHGIGTFRNCSVKVNRDAAFPDDAVYGVQVVGDVLVFENLAISIVDATGSVDGVSSGFQPLSGAANSRYLLRGCNIASALFGGLSTLYDIDVKMGGTVYVDRATRYDSTKVGFVNTTQRDARFKYADELTPVTGKPSITTTVTTNIATAATQSTAAATAAAAAKVVTDKLNTGLVETSLGSGVYQYTAPALAKAPGGGSGGVAGPGADSCTMTITNTTTGFPSSNADVWISTDAAGDNVVAGTLSTNSQGKVTFLLDAGVTYYLWKEKLGEEPIIGQSFVAVPD
jgi:hypothetical protein